MSESNVYFTLRVSFMRQASVLGICTFGGSSITGAVTKTHDSLGKSHCFMMKTFAFLYDEMEQ